MFFNQFKLVEFRDGRFGVRRGLLAKEFLDLYDPKLFTWYSENAREKYCKGTKAQCEVALAIYNKHKANKHDVGKIV